jgi:hypothetical protein
MAFHGDYPDVDCGYFEGKLIIRRNRRRTTTINDSRFIERRLWCGGAAFRLLTCGITTVKGAA